jgi:hypothetical protein
MHPDTPTVLRRRHLVLTVLRLGAVAYVLGGLLVLGRFLVPLTERTIGFDFWTYRAAVGVTVVVFVLPGVGLGLVSGRLARWVVPGPMGGCPGCGYAAGADQATCPECGAALAR